MQITKPVKKYNIDYNNNINTYIISTNYNIQKIQNIQIFQILKTIFHLWIYSQKYEEILTIDKNNLNNVKIIHKNNDFLTKKINEIIEEITFTQERDQIINYIISFLNSFFGFLNQEHLKRKKTKYNAIYLILWINMKIYELIHGEYKHLILQENIKYIYFIKEKNQNQNQNIILQDNFIKIIISKKKQNILEKKGSILLLTLKKVEDKLFILDGKMKKILLLINNNEKNQDKILNFQILNLSKNYSYFLFYILLKYYYDIKTREIKFLMNYEILKQEIQQIIETMFFKG